MLPLKIDRLYFAANNTPLLNNINLCISESGISIIMGHNGAGKSLLLRCMHGLLTPASGKILWSGSEATDKACRMRQAMVFQKPLMLNRSVSANINYVLKQRAKSPHLCDKYLQSAGLLDKSNQPARSLSGGEQQRLAIARALATEPEVFFLDEPTANLDPAATNFIEQQINNAATQDIKVIMVTHDIAQAKRIGDEILFMYSGKLTEHTNAQQFFSRPQSDHAREYLSAYLK